ncbi:MAG: hypothetical protein ACKOWD_02375 [Rhodoferax sp.]
MEMTAAYMAQTVAHLKAAGFEITESTDTSSRDGATVFHRIRYQCERLPDCNLALEVLTYPGGRESYFLELLQMGPMHSFSFPLDSWKFRPTSVEFKYYINPQSGLGLAFALNLAPSVK